ncbi:hypothetical protein KXV73_008354, partial [Aspergillus fumigatus]
AEIQKKRFTHEDYTVGWVCPLEVELIAALEMLDEEHEPLPQPPTDHNVYHLGSIAGYKVVIAGSWQAGNNPATAVVTQMRIRFPNLRFALLVGIGGGVPTITECGELRLGHVVVSQPVGLFAGAIQYDHGTARDGVFEWTGALTPPPAALLLAARSLASQCARSDKDHIMENVQRIDTRKPQLRWFKFPGVENDKLFPADYKHVCHEVDELIVVHRGTVAAGELVLKDSTLRDSVAQEYGVLCFEMEAAGAMTDFPCLPIRGISDYCDSHKNDSWHGFAAAAAAACARQLFFHLPIDEVNQKDGTDIHCGGLPSQQENQKLDTILASILGQLIRGLCHIPEQIQTFYKTYQRNEMQPQLGDILQMLDVTLRLYSHVYIIIDALDECSDFDGTRTHLISHVLDLQRHLNISFMATARFLPDIISKFQNLPSVEIRASDADVKRYVESNLPTMVRRRSDIHDFVSSEILKIADGMFSIARVYLDSLKGKCSITAIKKALDKCKTGWEVYEQAYEKVMKQIWQQIGDRAELAKRALAWLTFARRALTLTELQHALAVVVGESSFDEENLPDVEEMICSCSGLIIYNEKDHIVSLAHYTMQEYLEKTWTSWFPNAHRAIGEVCVTYLCYDDFEGRGCGREYNYEERCRKYPLYAYATESWLYHARKQPLDHSLVGKLLMSDEKFDAWVQSLKEETTRLQLAVELGLEDEVEALLNNRYQVNARDRCLSTAFQIAVGKGHERLAMLLHRYGARPVADMYTAAKIGCESNFLSQGGEMNLKDGHV